MAPRTELEIHLGECGAFYHLFRRISNKRSNGQDHKVVMVISAGKTEW